MHAGQQFEDSNFNSHDLSESVGLLHCRAVHLYYRDGRAQVVSRIGQVPEVHAMGSAQSRPEEEEPHFTGVRVTQDLLEQLSGRAPASRVQHPQQSQQPQAQHIGNVHDRRASVDEQVAQELEDNDELRNAVAKSRKIGGLLLKNEEQEAQKINQLADELTESEYRAPSRPLPCGPEREACLQCYKDHVKDPLQCAAAVDAYTNCARQAIAGFVG